MGGFDRLFGRDGLGSLFGPWLPHAAEDMDAIGIGEPEHTFVQIRSRPPLRNGP